MKFEKPTGLFRWAKPHALPIGEWRKWDKWAQKNFPVRYFIYETIPDMWDTLVRRVRNAKWWVLHRIHPKYRYNVVKTRLAPGYYDPDTLIFEASFALLCDFVEFNTVNEVINWNGTEEHMKAWQDMNYLYNWYKNVRPNREKEFEDCNPTPSENDDDWLELLDTDRDDPKAKEYDAYLRKWSNAEKSWEKEDEDMLIWLIKLRPFLWYA